MTSSLMNRYYKGSAIEYDEQNAVKNGKTKIRNLFYCQNNSHYKQTVLYYILLIGHIESNPGPNIVSGKPNLKNGSLKIAHINACSLLPKNDLIELEMSNNDIILVSETHLSRDIDNEDIQLRGFQNPIRVDRNRHGGGVAIFAKPNIYILGMATSTRLTGYSIKHPIIEYQNRYSVTRKTFFYENNDKIFRTINN